MVGIISYGSYIPLYRLSGDTFARAWGMKYTMGERAVAFYDEDSVTMAAAAVSDCLGESIAEGVEGLFLASTTLPYKEKQMASFIASSLDFPKTARTADFTDSLRCGTSAMNSALDAIKAGTAGKIMVASSDCRMGVPTSMREQIFGDGAAAVLIGKEDVAVTIEASYSINAEINDVWRKDNDRFVSGAEDRWAVTYGYMSIMHEAVNGLMKQCSLTPKDFSKIVLPGPDFRSHQGLVKSLGFDPKTQVQDSLCMSVGSTGAAHGLMVLVAALEEAEPGDRILFANYGNGADAFVLQVTDQIEKIRGRKGIKGHLESKKALSSYERYLRWRGLVEVEGSRRQSSYSSPTVLWREATSLLPLCGSKCKGCGLIDFPPQRVCYQCGSKDEFDLVKLSKKGTLFTYTEDYLSGAAFEDFVGIPVIDLEGGGRLRVLMTECEAGQMHIDMPVELVLRKMHEGGGYNNYFWKARPLR
jgi:3-hydroxy-3-methylglutaryl CoA synthase